MYLKIQNRNGSFELGGGSHPTCRLLEIVGIGLPSVTAETVSFAGMPGHILADKTDNARTITISADVSGDTRDLMKIYRILQEECEILFFFSNMRRKIKGICLNPQDVEKIIFGKLYKLVIQFECPHPYFTDFSPVEMSLSTRTNLFPTSFEDGQGYITLPAVATARAQTRMIKNEGDTRVYPTIYVSANKALDTIAIQNVTTGKYLKLQYEIASGEMIMIDVKNREITSNIHGSVINKITNDTILSECYLVPGENEFTVADIENGAVDATISYENQYKAVFIS